MPNSPKRSAGWRRSLESPNLTAAARAYITSAYERLQATANEWAQFKAAQMEITREMLGELSEEIREAISSLKLRGLDERAEPVA